MRVDLNNMYRIDLARARYLVQHLTPTQRLAVSRVALGIKIGMIAAEMNMTVDNVNDVVIKRVREKWGVPKYGIGRVWFAGTQRTRVLPDAPQEWRPTMEDSA